MDGPGGDSAVEISDGATYDFGDVGVGKSASHTFEIRNRADTDADNLTLSFTGVAFAFAGGSPAMSTTCGGFLAAHATCAVTLAFAPDGPGVRSGSLDIGFVRGSAGAVSRALTGRGTSSAAIVIADAPQFSFGSIAPGGVVEHEFTIANRGNADTNSTSVVLGGAAFHFEGGSYPGSGGTCAGSSPPGRRARSSWRSRRRPRALPPARCSSTSSTRPPARAGAPSSRSPAAPPRARSS